VKSPFQNEEKSQTSLREKKVAELKVVQRRRAAMAAERVKYIDTPRR
jgi:hypothetical protein